MLISVTVLECANNSLITYEWYLLDYVVSKTIMPSNMKVVDYF